ncbi:hypothetical protein PG996_006389 [Apiospora saccharicola]|uniref:Uncharacterized protein n=1 Tax=Apiospora saccharicola TaxID=335842 RepID=A0ABR1VRW6_9PEZI
MGSTCSSARSICSPHRSTWAASTICSRWATSGGGADCEQLGLCLAQHVVDQGLAAPFWFDEGDAVPSRPHLGPAYTRDAASGQTAVLPCGTIPYNPTLWRMHRS